ncbi:MAG TPA: DJ-1/PfpI family protein, partial [Polyangiaceae bacterium]|nr:DJ-1/PfpI family protein [Polyangiaceae bacterium]
MLPRVIIVSFDGFASMDALGPYETFVAASHLLPEGGYRVLLTSVAGGPCRTGSGLRVDTECLLRLRPQAGDTVLVAGAESTPVMAAARDAQLLGWLRKAAPVVRRLGSVCSGAFVLGELGVLNGKRCATHWAACATLAARFPEAQVQRDAIFVKDGTLWTSAGVTTGIDMALAMVEEDHGARIADAIAAQAVLYARRPGFQSQFSPALVAQLEASDPLGASIAWARRHLSQLTVESLAQQAGLALRTLHRRTLAVLGVTPAKLIERIRVEHARTLLSSTTLAQKVVAHQAGFSGNAQMQRALARHLGVDGRAVRLLFRSPA